MGARKGPLDTLAAAVGAVAAEVGLTDPPDPKPAPKAARKAVRKANVARLVRAEQEERAARVAARRRAAP